MVTELKFDIQSSALFSFLPTLVKSIVGILLGVVVSFLIRKGVRVIGIKKGNGGKEEMEKEVVVI